MGDAPGHLEVPPHFRPTEGRLFLELEERAEGGFVVRGVKGVGKQRPPAPTVEVRPDGVTVLSPRTLRETLRRDWPADRIVEVRAARPGVYLTVREPAPDSSGRERWVRVRLPLLGSDRQKSPDELIMLAGPWLAGEIGRVLGRPQLPDAYVAGPGWVEDAVEEAGRHGQLVYGVSAPAEHADPPPVSLEDGAADRIDVPPRPIAWRGLAVSLFAFCLLWLFVVGVCAGFIGQSAMFVGGMVGVLMLGVAVITIIGAIIDARQRVTITTPEAGVVDVDVRRFPFRRRRRLTSGNTRAVYLSAGGRSRSLRVSPETGKDKVLLSGLDPAVIRAAATLIERHLRLEPTDRTRPQSSAASAPLPATPVVPVAPPTDPCPDGWVMREGDDGVGTWAVTRLAAGVAEKAGTAGLLIGVIVGAVVAARLFPGRGPVPGVGGVIVGGVGLLILSERIMRALGPAVVRFDGTAIHLDRRGIFGRVRKRIDAWSVERLAVTAITAGEAKRPTAALQLCLRDGMRHGVIGVAAERDIRWLARKLASSLNMTEDVVAEGRTQI